MLETMDELLRVYEAMKHDLYTLLVKKSPNILDYEGRNGRIYGIATKLVEFRYLTSFKDTDPSLTLKISKTMKELVRRDIVMWGETSQIEQLYLLTPSTRLCEDDFRMTVTLKAVTE